MKPKLKDRVFFSPTEGGVYFNGPAGAFVLRGTHLYEWVERLLPYMQGQIELDQLVEPLSPDRRKMVRTLIHQLAERGCILDLSHEEPHELTDAELSTYRSSIRYIGEWHTSANKRFQAFRNGAVVALGDGKPFLGLTRGLFQAGLRTLVTLTSDDEMRTRLAGEVAAHQKKDLLFRWEDRPLPANASQEDWDQALHQFDVLVIAGGPLLQPLANRLSAYARSHGKRLLTGLVLQNAGWIGPMVSPDAQGCSYCATMRLQAAGEMPDPEPLPGLGSILVGQVTAFEVFKALTGARPSMSQEALLHVGADRLAVTRQLLAPWPVCPACGTAPSDDLTLMLSSWRAAQPLSPDQAWEKASTLVDPHVGLLDRVEPGERTQLPLSQCEAVVRLPGAQCVVGAGRDHTLSRHAALRLGLERYASALAQSLDDTQGALTLDGQPVQGVNVRDWSFVSGDTVDQWIGEGLLAETSAEAKQLLRDGAAPLAPLAVNNLDPWHHLLWKTVIIRYGLPLQAYRVVGPSDANIHVIALVSGGSALAVTAGRSPGEALERGLVSVVHALQSLPEGHVPADWAARQLPVRGERSGPEQSLAFSEPARNWGDWTPAAVSDLQDRRILIRPFTSDPAVARAGLLTGWVRVEC